jgi:hypothetical protein
MMFLVHGPLYDRPNRKLGNRGPHMVWQKSELVVVARVGIDPKRVLQHRVYFGGDSHWSAAERIDAVVSGKVGPVDRRRQFKGPILVVVQLPSVMARILVAKAG